MHNSDEERARESAAAHGLMEMVFGLALGLSIVGWFLLFKPGWKKFQENAKPENVRRMRILGKSILIFIIALFLLAIASLIFDSVTGTGRH